MVDPQSGTVVVEGHVVPMSVWSVSIPSCLKLFVQVLGAFFPNKELLDAVLDTGNTIALGKDASATLVTSPTGEFHLHDLVPTFPDNVKKCQELLNKAVALMRLCQAYFSTGGLRGTEVLRLENSSNWQILFNLLRFESHSKKGETHGQSKNKSVEHFMSPSLSRCSVIVAFLLRHRLPAGVVWPEPDTIKLLVRKFFADIFRLKNDNLNTKQMRDVLAMVVDYTQPLSMTKLTASPLAASKFHHSKIQHDRAYSASIGELDGNGRLTASGILLAREIHGILGEPRNNHSTSKNVPAFRQPRPTDLNAAAAHAYASAGAQVRGPQLEFVMHVLSGNRSAIAQLACGVGKSGGWILPLVYGAMFSQKIPHVLLIAPHNALVNQHAQQARESFGGTSLTVHTLTTAECESVTLEDLQANLLVTAPGPVRIGPGTAQFGPASRRLFTWPDDMAATRSRRKTATAEVGDDAGSESEEATIIPSQPSQSPTKSTSGISVGSASDDGTEDPTAPSTERCLAEDLGF
ncbi:hypothetical protein THAOC_21685, partial [Thalassiosira oceanica]